MVCSVLRAVEAEIRVALLALAASEILSSGVIEFVFRVIVMHLFAFDCFCFLSIILIIVVLILQFVLYLVHAFSLSPISFSFLLSFYDFSLLACLSLFEN